MSEKMIVEPTAEYGSIKGAKMLSENILLDPCCNHIVRGAVVLLRIRF